MATSISVSDLSVPELIELGRSATDGALADSDIIDSLTPPYDRRALLDARTRLFELTDAVLRQSSKGARMTENVAKVDLARYDFHVASYLPHLHAAHQIFYNQDEVLARIGATAEESDVFQIWAMRVRQFYLTVLTDPLLTSSMEEKNISVAELTVAFSDFEHIVAMDRERSGDKSDGSIDDLDQRVADFRLWIAAFLELAMTRLDNASELIESLGIAGGRA